ncbi:uncharacterized protein LOC129600849 [Paramacrobiotus metropolitanus]|uniref:uncharacterized protein LOC129600849 n=1 Tax=Paramacrobiotus metropolitanus TaxID=2943436 RepID=UPI00244619C7|nr:uncharacterized protein LOC129600849 [Paramacrobiotus metropolitanus]
MWISKICVILCISFEFCYGSAYIRRDAVRERNKRQVAPNRSINEAIDAMEGRLLDPTLLSMMFSASGVMPNVGSSTMSNAFATLCSYPYLYYYYQFCMGSPGPGSLTSPMFPYTANSAPSFASPSSTFPMYSAAGPNAVETSPGAFGSGTGTYSGSNPAFPPSFNYMNPYAWPNSGPSESPGIQPSYGPEPPPSPGPVPSGAAPVGNPGSSPPMGMGQGFPGPRSTFRGSPLTQAEAPKASPMLEETPVIVAVERNPVLEYQPPVSSGVLNGSVLVEFPRFYFERNATRITVNTTFDENRNRSVAVTVNSISLDPLRDDLSVDLKDSVERKELLRTLTKLSGRNRHSVAQMHRDFERYLSFAFELVAADEKNGLVNNIISAIKKDPGQIAVRPEFRGMFNTIMMAFVNCTLDLNQTCLAYYFCKATEHLASRNLVFGVEVLRTVVPFAARLLDQQVPGGINALEQLNRGTHLLSGSKTNSSIHSCSHFFPGCHTT